MPPAAPHTITLFSVHRLCIWRLVRNILQRPPGFDNRLNLGPKAVAARCGGDLAYNRYVTF